MRRLTHEERDALPARYLAGETSKDLANSLGVTDVAILNHLRKMGVDRRDPSLARRQYDVWDAAFRVLTPEAAYWLGFLMADGCVHDETKITLALATKDRDHLEKFRGFLKSDLRPIQTVPQTNSCSLKIHSRQIVIDLERYGIVPRKSLIAVAKGGVESEPGFWLGLLDGDGSIGESKGRLRVRFFGTPALMGQFAGFVKKREIRGRNRSFDVGVTVRADRLAEVSLLGGRAKNLLRLLYSSSPVCLTRKKLRAGIDFG